MCRHTGYLGPPRSPAELFFGGTHSLEVQSYRPRELLHGHVNVDGYGVTWYPGPEPVRIAEQRPVWHDPDLPSLLRSIQASPILAAVRNTTPGIPVERSGLAPLTKGIWSFSLNGFVEDFRKGAMQDFHGRLSPSSYGELQGTSDTEALFHLLLDHVRSGEPLSEGVRGCATSALEVVSAHEVDLHLNLLASDGESLVATRYSTTPEQNSLYTHPGEGGGGWVASEPLDASRGWTRVPKISLVEITLERGVEVTAL